MDEKGAYTFPFHNLPPEPVFLRKGLFLFFLPFQDIGQNKSRWRLLLTATLVAYENKSQFKPPSFTSLLRLCVMLLIMLLGLSLHKELTRMPMLFIMLLG